MSSSVADSVVLPRRHDGAAPSYEHPPLVEVWLGVGFDGERNLKGLEADSLARRLGPEWLFPRSEDRTAKPDRRELANTMNDRAIRWTSSHLAYGWTGHNGGRYPRYEAIRDGFVSVLDGLHAEIDLCDRQVNPERWSVRYVNEMRCGTVWNEIGD